MELKSLWQEHVDNMKFTVLDRAAVYEQLMLWRSSCEHVSDRDLLRYEKTGQRVFVQTGRGVVCQKCAVNHVHALNKSWRRLYAAEDLGEVNSFDEVETRILKMWDDGVVEKNFAFYIFRLKEIRNPGPFGVAFGVCTPNREQLVENLERRHEKSDAKFRIFRDYSDYARWDVTVVAIDPGEEFVDTRIYADIYQDWQMIDGFSESMKLVTVSGHNHELERIANPYGHKVPWLVLKGTNIGMAETAWNTQRPGRLNEDPMAEEFGKPMATGPFDIDLYYEGDLPQLAIVKK